MRKMDIRISIGLFIIALTFVLERFTAMPDFIYGLGFGVGIAFEFVGILSTNHDISKLKNLKRNLLKRLFQ